MDSIWRGRRCGSYAPGHQMHYIQVMPELRGEDPGVPVEAEVEPDGWITLTSGDGVERVWTHDPQRLIKHLAAYPIDRVLRFERSLIGVGHPNGMVHRISVGEEATPCPDPNEDTSKLSLVELAERRGGFVIPGLEAIERIEREQRERGEEAD